MKRKSFEKGFFPESGNKLIKADKVLFQEITKKK